MNMAKKKKVTRRWASFRKNDSIVVRRVMIGVIVTAIVVVVISLVGSLLLNRERVVKAKLDVMAKEYYEGYIYEHLINGAMSQDEIEKAMERYVDWGFAPVNLRQLLLYDNQRNIQEAGFVREYCDENNTSVKFYPEAPYDKKSYRLEYDYKCEW